MVVLRILTILSIVVVLSVIWIVLSAFKTGSSLFSSTILPQKYTLIHFKELFTETDFPIWYLNTLKIATINMLISVVITSITAYAFARFKFKGRKSSLMAILVLQMFLAILAMTAIHINEVRVIRYAFRINFNSRRWSNSIQYLAS